MTWLWRSVANISEDERALLLKFATGSSRLPPGGFDYLARSQPPAFVVARSGDTSNLPQASTCTRTLRLPPYESEQKLHDKLMAAIRHGSEGFAFA